MIVLGALVARLRGWRPAGQFRLGAWALPVNIGALVYGVGALVDMLWPRTPAAPWYIDYSMGVTWLAIVGVGALYMIAARPYDSGSAPAGDAWKLARA
jgi:hypothetical protein